MPRLPSHAARLSPALVFLLGVLPSLALATGSADPRLIQIQAQLDLLEQAARHWEHLSTIEFTLGMLVAVMGASVAVFQRFDKLSWSPYVVAAMGILISAITFTTKEYFEVDHKTYRRSAKEAQHEIFTAREYLKSAQLPDIDNESRDELLVLAAASVSKLNAIAEKVEGPMPSTHANLPSSWMDAHAQALPPAQDWTVAKRLDTPTAYVFVGSGKGATLMVAKAAALNDARQAMATSLRMPAADVERFSKVVDSRVRLDARTRTYQYFVRLELNRAFAPRR